MVGDLQRLENPKNENLSWINVYSPQKIWYTSTEPNMDLQKKKTLPPLEVNLVIQPFSVACKEYLFPDQISAIMPRKTVPKCGLEKG